MKSVFIDEYEFFKFSEGDAEIYFSTAKANLDFNKSTEKGKENLQNLKKWFNMKEVGYLNQIHSDLAYMYNGKIHSGDAIITNQKQIGIGVFSADCVPVIIYDTKKKVAAAVHSGWRSTIENISLKTVEKMIKEYSVSVEDLRIYIGPHNMQCCYEVGEDLVEQFKNLSLYKNSDIIKGRHLSLQNCIIAQFYSLGVKGNQIKTLDICTSCNKEKSMHSYRKHKEKSGRMFSFVCIRN